MHGLWDHQTALHVPAGLIYHQHRPLGRIDALVAGEGGQGEGVGVNPRQKPLPTLPRARPAKMPSDGLRQEAPPALSKPR